MVYPTLNFWQLIPGQTTIINKKLKTKSWWRIRIKSRKTKARLKAMLPGTTFNISVFLTSVLIVYLYKLGRSPVKKFKTTMCVKYMGFISLTLGYMYSHTLILLAFSKLNTRPMGLTDRLYTNVYIWCWGFYRHLWIADIYNIFFLNVTVWNDLVWFVCAALHHYVRIKIF